MVNGHIAVKKKAMACLVQLQNAIGFFKVETTHRSRMAAANVPVKKAVKAPVAVKQAKAPPAPMANPPRRATAVAFR